MLPQDILRGGPLVRHKKSTADLNVVGTEKDTREGLRKFVDVKIEEDAALQALCDKKGVVLLAFVGSYVPLKYNPASSGSATISIPDEFGMEEALNQIQDKMGKKAKRAYLLINSLGGVVGSSFKIAQAIRDAFDDITVFVPHIAASGGTLLALTGNKIRMGAMSQLGPIDPQIPYPKYGFVSSNSIARAKRRLDKKFQKQQEQEMGYPDRHMVEMLDPVVYEEFHGWRIAVKEYLSTILKKTKYTQEKIDNISKNLIFTLPTHSFVIDKNMSKEMGLKVVSDGDAEEWRLMRNWFAKYVGEETDRHFIRYCIPKT